ncbi:MAG: GNAT family N-acetyltransferase [Solobacterium sp.]|nr:GNAT family N-acetyltransferase [Solobacterium sp.]
MNLNHYIYNPKRVHCTGNGEDYNETVMKIYETDAEPEVIETLIAFSKDWEAEESCYGYRANTREDIEGRRIFLAEENGEVLGCLFGVITSSKRMRSIMPEDTPFFEAEELYVIPKERSKGIGSALFHAAEEAVKDEAEYIVLSTATKNWKAVFHFYLEELDMTFWSATLFKKIR